MQLPAYLRKSTTPDRFLAGLGGTQPASINRKNNRWTLIDGAGNKKPIETLHLDVVIIDASEHVSKVFYEGDYDPNDISAPDCFSDNGERASVNAGKPQNAEGGFLCATCPHAAWGSGGVSRISGKQTKACQDKKKVAALTSGDGWKIAYLLDIPPGSFKHFKQYLATLVGNGMQPDHVVTRLTFDEAATGVINFAALDWVPEEVYAHATELVEKHATDAVVGRLDKPRQPLLAGPAATPAPPKEDKPFFEQKNPTPVKEAIADVMAEPEQQLPPGMTAEQFAAFTKWQEEQQAKAAKAGAPPRPRGRPKKEETTVGPGPIPEGTFPQQSAPPAPQQSFGMVQDPPKVDEKMGAILDSVFGGGDKLAGAFKLPV